MVANLTRRDGLEFLAIAAGTRLHTRVERFRLDDANRALDHLRSGALSGVAVLDIATPPA